MDWGLILIWIDIRRCCTWWVSLKVSLYPPYAGTSWLSWAASRFAAAPQVHTTESTSPCRRNAARDRTSPQLINPPAPGRRGCAAPRNFPPPSPAADSPSAEARARGLWGLPSSMYGGSTNSRSTGRGASARICEDSASAITARARSPQPSDSMFSFQFLKRVARLFHHYDVRRAPADRFQPHRAHSGEEIEHAGILKPPAQDVAHGFAHLAEVRPGCFTRPGFNQMSRAKLAADDLQHGIVIEPRGLPGVVVPNQSPRRLVTVMPAEQCADSWRSARPWIACSARYCKIFDPSSPPRGKPAKMRSAFSPRPALPRVKAAGGPDSDHDPRIEIGIVFSGFLES